MKSINTSLFDFPTLCDPASDYVYVDKTARLYGESQQALGRPDAVLETAKGIYVFEFKFNRSAQDALDQCRERNYAAPYAADPRPVWYIALNYNPATRTLDDPLCERVTFA